MAISLITVVLAALGTFTLNTMAATSRAAGPPGGGPARHLGDGGTGRGPGHGCSSRDATPRAWPTSSRRHPASVRSSLAVLKQAVDQTALPGAGATATISTSAVPQLLNGVAYSVNTYLENCVVVAGSTLPVSPTGSAWPSCARSWP